VITAGGTEPLDFLSAEDHDSFAITAAISGEASKAYFVAVAGCHYSDVRTRFFQVGTKGRPICLILAAKMYLTSMYSPQ